LVIEGLLNLVDRLDQALMVENRPEGLSGGDM
jgi:hypothetical protein